MVESPLVLLERDWATVLDFIKVHELFGVLGCKGHVVLQSAGSSWKSGMFSNDS